MLLSIRLFLVSLVPFILELYGRKPPHDETRWHRWSLFWPVRTIDGELELFEVWRRRDGDRWIYRSYSETEEEVLVRMGW